jgi:pyruvate dehydrogenase E2 component (dihydrolipoamide acetyltransferase)
MATKVVMEALSPTMEEGRLVRWAKQEGEAVVTGDVLAEVETDKAVMELAARADGTLRRQLLPEGATAPVGQLLAVIGAPDEDISAVLAAAPAAPAPAAAGSGAASSAPARSGAPASAPARSGATASGPAGSGATALAPSGSGATASASRSAAAASPAVASTPTAAAAGAAAPSPSSTRAPTATGGPTAGASTPPMPAGGNGGRVRTSPLARRLASERGLDLQALAGSGPAGRIIKRDIEQAVLSAPAAPATAAAYRDVPLTQIRRTIARRLAESLGPIPTFYLTAEYDVTRVSEMRSAMSALGDDYKVSFNDIVIKAVATALRQHPAVNAHWLGDAIRYFGPVHIGMAVAIDDGLITPVLFDADTKTLRELSRESRDLAARARARKLTPAEYTGSTFSISNLGMFGIDEFTAIINPPEAAILAIGAVESKPVVVDGTVTVRPRLRVTMSCDHRVIDGATGAQFLKTLRQLIENPLLLVY